MFKASLFIFEQEYNLLNYKIESHQPADKDGLPNCRVVFGKIELSYQSVKNDSEFVSAAVSNSETVKGYIRVYKRDGFQKFIDYQFANAYVLKFQELFDSLGKTPMTTKIIIGAGIVKRDTMVFENYWNKNNPYTNENVETTVIEQELKPELLSYHIEDSNSNIIKENKIKKDQEIYLVINSQNANGQIADIDLQNKAIDFEYNGKWMKDDIITDISIISETTKIKLKAIKQR